MKPHAPPPLDASDAVWRAYMADQLAAIHQCFEDRMDATDKRVEDYHTENKAATDLIVNALGEVKAMAQPAFTWVSAEEKQRERDALVQAGRELEREKWATWFRRAETGAEKLIDWGTKAGAGLAIGYVGHYFGLW